jgi:hypothetical protein
LDGEADSKRTHKSRCPRRIPGSVAQLTGPCGSAERATTCLSGCRGRSGRACRCSGGWREHKDLVKCASDADARQRVETGATY